MHQSWSLDQKTAVITGGTKGIGLAIANELLSLGASIIVIARDEKRMAALKKGWDRKGFKTSGIITDLTDPTSYPSIVKQLGKKKIDILINNVGDNTPKSFLDHSENEYRRIFEINLFSSIQLCRALFPRFSKSASIVNISSVAGMENVGTGSYYGMSKSAINHLTKSLASEWAAHGIRVNAVAPWYTHTDRIKPLLKNAALKEKVISSTPLGRLAEPEDIAGLVAFLCMEKASYITGETIAVDGGFLARRFL